jgi:polar amino acid transport system permease protein
MSLRSFGWPELQFLLLSLRWTLALAVIAFVGGGLLGAVVAALRVSPSRAIRRAMDVYITLFQGTPLLVQLLLWYYGSSFAGFTPNAWIAAALAFAFNSSAFFGEIWRGSIEAVPRGQWDAALALGMRHGRALRLVILPQALRVMVPPTIGYMVQIVKGTSVASLIGVVEVTRTAVMVNTVTFEPVPVFGTVCALYFALCWPLSYLSERMARQGRSGREEAADLLRQKAPVRQVTLIPRPAS